MDRSGRCGGSRPASRSTCAATQPWPPRTRSGRRAGSRRTRARPSRPAAAELFAARAGDLIELDFPAKVVTEAEPPAGLLAALGVERAVGVFRNEFDYMVELTDERAV